MESGAVVRLLTHELRQPLSTIETAAYYLKMILEGSEPRAETPLDKIQQMVHQLNWILGDAVHYLQAAPPMPQQVDLTEFICEQSSWQAVQQVELDWAESGSPPKVWMDPGQAQHMVRAILSVFRQIGRADQPVSLSLYRDGDETVLECRCEAPPHLCQRAEDLLKAFTPHLPAGSGLALASVKRIVDAHAGRVSISGSDGVLKLEVSLPSC